VVDQRYYRKRLLRCAIHGSPLRVRSVKARRSAAGRVVLPTDGRIFTAGVRETPISLRRSKASRHY
jgi:hypothetical protein